MSHDHVRAVYEDRALVLSAGCDDLVRKPFQEEEIFNKMGKYLNVQYKYSEIKHVDPASLETEIAFRLDEALYGLSLEWRKVLYSAAVAADGEAVNELVQDRKTTHAMLARAISVLVENFRFDVLISALQPGL